MTESWLAPTTLSRFGTLTHAQFLREYWQKKPLFVKNAAPEIAGLLTGDDLAGLACEESAESRIVLKHPRNRWELRRGPFDAKTFRTLPAKDWTLLVQAVDHFLPEAAELLSRFDFLPHWRIDDLMVSYAVEGGGVGPHYDSYDVFLIQGVGTRTWRIGPEVDDTDLLPHPDLRILKKMPVIAEFTCEPGDLLYLPPRLAHWGIARGECMTYSVGFRAPSDRELLDAFCNHVIERTPELQRFSDAGRPVSRAPGEIDATAVALFRRRLDGLLRAPGDLEDFLGRWLSEPKYTGHEPQPPARRWTAATLRKALARDGIVAREAASRFLLERPAATLFVDGQCLPLESAAAVDLAARIANQRTFPGASLGVALTDPGAARILLSLFNSGHLYFPDDDSTGERP